VPCHGLRAAKNERGFLAQHAAIDSELDIGIEHRDECVEVAIARRGEERVDDLPLSSEVRIRLRGSLHTAPGAAGQLLRGGFGAVKGSGDIRKRHAEHVVQDEREPLGGGQRIEHHEQRQPDRLGEQRLVFGVNILIKAHHRVRDMN
jgi:hypothetical protein